MARDPFSWAEDYARQSTSLGAANEENAQNALTRMFVTEAARQAPFASLPTDLALQNNQYDRALGNQVAADSYRASIKPNMPPGALMNTINNASKMYGVDSDALMTIADLESSFNPRAANKSGAAGLFQFMPGTARQYGLTNPYDPVSSADAAARLARDNAGVLQAAGVPVNAGTLYLAHQQGAAGAAKLLANPNAPAESIVGRAAVLQNGGRPGMTAGMFAKMWTDKADKLYAARIENRNRNRTSAGPKLTFNFNGEEVSLDGPSDEETVE